MVKLTVDLAIDKRKCKLCSFVTDDTKLAAEHYAEHDIDIKFREELAKRIREHKRSMH